VEVDALDEEAADKHLQSVIEKAGRVDISFNAVGIPNAKILGVPLIELDVEQFSLPVTAYAPVLAPLVGHERRPYGPPIGLLVPLSTAARRPEHTESSP
jgi:hypothetical protein